MAKVYLGVDQSLTQPGFALVSEDGTVLRGGSLSVADRLRGARRLAHITECLRGFVLPHTPVGAAMEGASLGSTHREFDLGSVFGAVQCTIFASYELEPRVVQPASLKKFATGSDSADKAAVMYAVKTSWGFPTDDDNVADAIVLAQIARALDVKDAARTRAQVEVIQSLLSPAKPVRRTVRKSPSNL